jgi:p25-alpha
VRPGPGSHRLGTVLEGQLLSASQSLCKFTWRPHCGPQRPEKARRKDSTWGAVVDHSVASAAHGGLDGVCLTGSNPVQETQTSAAQTEFPAAASKETTKPHSDTVVSRASSSAESVSNCAPYPPEAPNPLPPPTDLRGRTNSFTNLAYQPSCTDQDGAHVLHSLPPPQQPQPATVQQSGPSATQPQMQPKSEQAQRSAALHSLFLEFAQFGTRSTVKSMDIFRFMKLCRECSLLSKPSDASSIDLVFYKVCHLTSLLVCLRMQMHGIAAALCATVSAPAPR